MSLTPEAFAFVRSLVHREAAIVLLPGKEYLVEARLAPLARAAGAPDVSSYVAALQPRATRAELIAVVEALTTNETSWFRDGSPFEVFRTAVVPELLAALPAARGINLWSAACSSGQEPYSLAMVLAEEAADRRVEIVASDISQEMVSRTAAGSYSQLEVGRGLPAPMMVKHFQRVGTQWQVSPRLRGMVRAQRINLAAPLPPLPVFDVVFLRNVLIYFDAPTKRAILQRVRQVLSPRGYLFLGGAESTLGVDDNWDRITVGRYSLYRPRSATIPTRPPLAPPTGPSLPLMTAPPSPWPAAAESR